MIADQIVALRHATPFRPFFLCLADARSLVVQGSDCLSVAAGGRILVLYLPDSNATEIIDIDLIVSLRFGEREVETVETAS